jgi:TatD DNase family protein
LQQKELFTLQLNLATEFNLPVIIHSRNSTDDVINLLNDFISSNKKLTGVFHCFSGDIKHLNMILNMGFYIGFDGNITYPENENLRKIASKTPIDKLLLETDSPYLTPVPKRNLRNEPLYLQYVADCVASIQNRSIEEITKITTDNSRSLFRI